jgi:hypothetical protein
LFISNDGLDSPTSGSGNFDPVAPGWSIDFTTANAIVWCYGDYGDLALGCSYVGLIAGKELYGPGGFFSVIDPKGLGLTFSGIVTGGSIVTANNGAFPPMLISLATGATVYPPPSTRKPILAAPLEFVQSDYDM